MMVENSDRNARRQSVVVYVCGWIAYTQCSRHVYELFMLLYIHKWAIFFSTGFVVFISVIFSRFA